MKVGCPSLGLVCGGVQLWLQWPDSRDASEASLVSAEHQTSNYITPLAPCKIRGQVFQHVAVVVDRLKKLRHFIPTATLEAEELADVGRTG
jgi:hypothetical protein